MSQLRPDTPIGVRMPVGSKYVRGVNDVRPRCQVIVLTVADCRPWGCGDDRTRLGPVLC